MVKEEEVLVCREWPHVGANDSFGGIDIGAHIHHSFEKESAGKLPPVLVIGFMMNCTETSFDLLDAKLEIQNVATSSRPNSWDNALVEHVNKGQSLDLDSANIVVQQDRLAGGTLLW